MQFERWADLRIDLGQAAELDLGPSLYEGDTNPLKVGVRLYDAAGEVAVSGDPAARAVTASGQPIAPLATGKSGNTAWCIVPQGALQRGLLRVYLRAADSADTAVMLYAHGTVRDTGDGDPLNPGQPVPNLEEMQEAAAQAVAAAAAAEDDVAGLRGVITPYHEDSMVATRAYTSGDILMVGSVIYKAKQNITSGTELTSTYVSEITLREYLSGTGLAFGNLSHAEGDAARASGAGAHAEGYKTVAGGNYSHAEGSQTSILNGTAHAEGISTQANGNGAHAEGLETQAYSGSHAEGYKSKTTASYAHAEGRQTTASASSAHAEGYQTTASGTDSHAEGDRTTASGSASHAEGAFTTASGIGAHAEGNGTTASGICSHTEGYASVASGTNSHAEGENTIANHRNQHVFGSLNVADPSSAIADDPGTYVEIVGNGGSTDHPGRSNARTLDWDGNEALAGSLTLGMGTADEVTITAAQLKQLLALIA